MFRKMNSILKIFGMIVASLMIIFVTVSAYAEYPSNPITMYIGYKAGGGTDTMGRILAKIMEKELGVQVNVVNKAGAGGGIAAMTVMRAKPDGYTMNLAASDTLNWHPLLNKKLTYDLEDFEFAGMLTCYQNGLIAPMEAPYDNLKEFIEYAQNNPGAKYAHFNAGSKMIMEFIAQLKDLEINYVPVKGGSGAAQVILGNEVDLTYSGGIHARYPNRIKLIAAATSERQSAYPDVPTIKESGVPLATDTLTTLTLPDGTPQNIIDKLENTLRIASKNPDLIKISKKLKYPVCFRTAEEAYVLLAEQWKQYEEMIEVTGFEAK